MRGCTCQSLRGTALLLGVIATIAMVGCAGITNEVTVGFVHESLTTKFGEDPFSWKAGGTIGLSFEEQGMSGVEVCGVGGITFISSAPIDTDEGVRTSFNNIPAAYCIDVDLDEN